MKDNKQELSRDEIFDLLSSSRRRFIIRKLQTEGSSIELGELAAELAAKENDIPPAELSTQQRKRSYVSLYQTHIPKLAESGVVTYDADSGLIEVTDSADELSVYLDFEMTTIPWEMLYLSVALFGLGGVLVSYMIRFPDAPVYVSIVVLSVFIVLSLTHYYSVGKN